MLHQQYYLRTMTDFFLQVSAVLEDEAKGLFFCGAFLIIWISLVVGNYQSKSQNVGMFNWA